MPARKTIPSPTVYPEVVHNSQLVMSWAGLFYFWSTCVLGSRMALAWWAIFCTDQACWCKIWVTWSGLDHILQSVRRTFISIAVDLTQPHWKICSDPNLHHVIAMFVLRMYCCNDKQTTFIILFSYRSIYSISSLPSLVPYPRYVLSLRHAASHAT